MNVLEGWEIHVCATFIRCVTLGNDIKNSVRGDTFLTLERQHGDQGLRVIYQYAYSS